MTATTPPMTVAELVDATPPSRDRYIDFLRALSIAVVVCWHWVFSVTHWDHGHLTMPNPIGDVPLLWAATWLLQVMPLFFFVGGYANAASWTAVRRDGGSWRGYARRRLERLFRPLIAFVVAWTVVDTTLRLTVNRYTGVLQYGRVVFMPLWFLTVYTIVTLAAPVTWRLHERLGALVVVGLGSAIVLGDLARFHYGLASFGSVNSLLVFAFAHQLGYLDRDGTFERIGRHGRSAVSSPRSRPLS